MSNIIDIEINDPKSIIQFAIIFNNLKNLFEETNLYFNKNGLYLQAMDGSHICCCELNLKSDWFCKYKIKKEVVIGVHLEIIDRILSCLDRKLKLQLLYNKNDKFSIIMSDDNIKKHYEMAIIDIDSDIMEIPKVEYTADIELKGMYLKNYINELSLFGEDLILLCNDTNITLKTSGDGNTSVIIIKDEHLDEYSIEEDAELRSSYNIKYIKNITNFVKLSKNIYIGVSDAYPLALIYNLDENKDNNIKFYIAPKILDEEEY